MGAAVGVEAERGRRAASLSLARLVGVTLVTSLAAFATPAAAGPTEADLKSARDLFAAAEKDEDAGRWSDALDKLHRVADVKLTSGVRYHVALCEEHLGHMVTALGDFAAAQAQARADGAHDVLRLVGRHLDDLGPRVPRLTVRVVPADVVVTVKLDGISLPASSVGTPMPVDPGPHHLEATPAPSGSADASAPPRAPAVADVTLQERDVTSLELKLGEPAAAASPAPAPVAAPVPMPAPAPAPAPEPTATPASSATRTSAIVATAGAAVLAAGGVLAFVLAGNAVNSGQQQCAGQRGPCDSEKSTVRAWDFTAAGAWIGAAGVATLAVLLWMQPQTPEAEAAHATLVVGPTSAALWGRF